MRTLVTRMPIKTRLSAAAVAPALLVLFGMAASPAARAQQPETPGVNAPQSAKGTVVKGRAPVAKELLRVTFPKPKEFRLPSGLRVLVLEDHRLPTLRFSLLMKAGSLYEEKPGVAAMTGQMMNEGTKTRSGLEIAEEAQELGISLTAGAGAELATVGVSGLSDTTDRMIELMVDVLRNPAFPEARLAQIKFQRIAALPRRRTNPGTVAGDLVAKVLYGASPYARIEDTAEEITAITREDLVAYHDRRFRPNEAILGITGDVKADVIAEKFKKALADWQPGPDTPKLPTTQGIAPQTTTRIHLVDRPGSQQTVLAFGNIGITRNDPDYIPLVVANRILGGGGSARLFQNLREDKGFTYGAYSSFFAPRWPGTWGASASVRTPVTEPAVAEFFKEFARLQSEPVSPDELGRAKRAIVGSFARTLESPDNILGRTLELIQNNLPLNYWDTYPAKIQAVSAADVQRVTKKYLGANRIQLIAVGERSAIEEPLRKYGPVLVYDTEGNLIPRQ